MGRRADRVVAIDGPAGSGKSTAARNVARALQWIHVDTGAMYRALAWHALETGCDPDDARALMRMLRGVQLTLSVRRGGALRVAVNRRDITRPIRHPRVSGVVSRVARHPSIRCWMVQRQRAMRRRGPLVMEGRDIGTVVFPHARWKFFLSAAVTERAKRRRAELAVSGKRLTMREVLRDVRSRDYLDRRRRMGALKQARDAIRIDTTHTTAREVMQRIMCAVREVC